MKKSGSHKGNGNNKSGTTKPDLKKPKINNKPDLNVEATRERINQYRAEYEKSLLVNKRPPIDPDVFLHLCSLKRITSEPKQDQPDKAYKAIQENLGAAESGETLRQERWPEKIHCPYCQSTDIKRLSEAEQKDSNIYKYICNNCKEKFNDDSETEIESGTTSLHTWMLCWYLLGCTDSLQYIASKLGLNIATVERMILHMRKLFNAEEPLTHMLNYDQWLAQRGGKFKEVMQRDLEIKAEQRMGYTPGGKAPRDTAELRRQHTRDTLHLQNKATTNNSKQTAAPKGSGKSSTPRPRGT